MKNIKPTAQDEIACLIKEHENWQKKLEALREAIKRVKAKETELIEKRKPLLIEAKALENAAAQKKLDELSEAWLRSVREREDLEGANTQVEQKLKEFESALRTAVRREKVEKIEALYPLLLVTARAIDEKKAALKDEYETFDRLRREAQAIGSELGVSDFTLQVLGGLKFIEDSLTTTFADYLTVIRPPPHARAPMAQRLEESFTKILKTLKSEEKKEVKDERQVL